MKKPIKDISITHAHCRVYGHNWDTQGIEFALDCIIEELRCDDCLLVRVDRVQRRTGFVLRRKYVYPPEYLRKDKTKIGRPELGQLRLWLQDHAGR